MSTPKTDSAAIRQIIRAVRKADWTLVRVNDGEDILSVSNEKQALDAITAVDAAWLILKSPNGARGQILFVLGNDPEEVAADWSVNLSPVLDPLTESWWS